MCVNDFHMSSICGLARNVTWNSAKVEKGQNCVILTSPAVGTSDWNSLGSRRRGADAQRDSAKTGSWYSAWDVVEVFMRTVVTS